MTDRLWVVIPAAGVGRRMAVANAVQEIPKQYLPLANRSVIEWAIAPFLACSDVAKVMVALAPNDNRFAALSIARDGRIQTTTGGVERADSVLQGLKALSAHPSAARASDWVLVHDAARPCLAAGDVAHLIRELASHEVGGVLAVPVTDTLKLADSSQHVQSTVPRAGLWRALTPQMFRYGLLVRALQSAADANVVVTDEAAAVERLGSRPKMVLGRADNIKITVPEDLGLAEYILRTLRR